MVSLRAGRPPRRSGVQVVVYAGAGAGLVLFWHVIGCWTRDGHAWSWDIIGLLVMACCRGCTWCGVHIGLTGSCWCRDGRKIGEVDWAGYRL